MRKFFSVLVAALLLVLPVFAEKNADLTLVLSRDSEVAIVYVNVLPAVSDEELDELKIDEENAAMIKRGRERIFSLQASRAYTVLAEREWEGVVYRFVETVTLSENGTRVVILPEAQEE